MNLRRLGALAGIIGPTLFMIVFLLQGWFASNYDPRRMSISELALTSSGWIHIANMILLGATELVFARGLAAEFPTGKASKAGPILLSIIGICAIGSGIFVTEPTAIPTTEWAWHGWVHIGFAMVAFVLFPILAVVYYRRFREEAEWRSLAGWSLLVALVTTLLLVLLFFGPGIPGVQGFMMEWSGVLQRLDTIIFNGWLVAVALKLYERSQLADASDAHYEEPLRGVPNQR
jgi:hypothetical membrane protein